MRRCSAVSDQKTSLDAEDRNGPSRMARGAVVLLTLSPQVTLRTAFTTAPAVIPYSSYNF